MRKVVATGAAMLLTLSVILSGCGSKDAAEAPKTPDAAAPKQEAPKPSQISLGAGSQGGVYYPVGVGLAKVISAKVPGLTITPEVTGAAVENVVLLGKGEVGIGMTNATALVKAANGEKPFQEKINNASIMIGGLQPGAAQVVVKKDSPIKSVEDLKGKRVGVGPQGGAGSEALAEFLPFVGVQFSDIKASYVAYGDAMTQMKDGQLDAVVVTAGLPTPAVNEFAVQTAYRILQIPADKREAFIKKYPYYMPIVVPKGTYAGLEEDIHTYATVNAVAVRQDLNEEVVYQMTKAVFENLPDVHVVHPAAKAITLEAATAFTGFRYHPGAARYYKEQGKTVPTN